MVCGLPKVAIFTTNVDAENQCLINHKCFCGALNRHFCQTAVSGSALRYVVYTVQRIIYKLFSISIYNGIGFRTVFSHLVDFFIKRLKIISYFSLRSFFSPGSASRSNRYSPFSSCKYFHFPSLIAFCLSR